MERENYWTRRVARRRMLGGSVVAGAGVAGWALAGCGDDDSKKSTPTSSGGNGTTTTGTSAAGSPTAAKAVGTPASVNAPSGPEAANIPKDGTLRVRQLAPWASINPYKGLDSGLTLGFTVFDHLWYTPLDTGVRENFLAEKIEQPDPLHINIKIGQANFHNKAPINGRAVKAADVKASFESAAKQTAISNSSWWTQSLDHVEAIDDTTLTIVMKQVDAWTFSSTNAGSPIAGSIIPEEIAKNVPFMDTNIIGSGRYEFVSSQNGTNLQLKRFDNWRLKPQPYTAGLQYKLIQEQAQALAAFQAKEIDQLLVNNKQEKDQLVAAAGAKNVTVDSETSRAVWLLEARGDGQWKDARVSQALSLGLDRKEFIELMAFGEGKLSGPVPPAFTSQAMTEKEINDTYGKFDPADAKAKLAAAGFDTSKEYQLKYIVPGDNYAQFAQILQSQLQKNLGIKTKLVGEDFGKWLAQSLYGSQFDGFISYPTLAYDDPSSYIGAYGKKIGGRPNWSGFLDDELDDLLTKQKATLADADRNKQVHDIQLKAWEKGAPFIPVFVAVSNTVSWNYYKNRIVGRGSYGLFNGQYYIDKG